MVENEICKHPAINHVVYTPHSYNETHYWTMSASLLKMSKQLFNGHRPPTNYGPRLTTRRYLVDCIKGNVPDFWIPIADEELVYSGWNALCNKYARPVFFEKSPQHLHHWASLELIMKWAMTSGYNVRYIGLVRNPMAVMYSAFQLFSTDPNERQYEWVSCNRNMLAMRELVGRECFYTIRYEDIIARPNELFGDIFTFLGLDSCNEVGNKVHNRSLDLWRDDNRYTINLDESVLRVARYFGYQDLDVYNPPKPKMSAVENIRQKIAYTIKHKKGKVYNRYIKIMMPKFIRRWKRQ